MIFKSLKAHQIIDSRGEPTIEVCLSSSRGKFLAICPSGASTGSKELPQIRDSGDDFFKKGCMNIVNYINLMKFPKQLKNIYEADLFIKKHEKHLGGLGVTVLSIVFFKALTNIKVKSFPKPFFNVINGGKHAKNKLDFQEYWVCPQYDSFEKNYQVGVEIYHDLKETLGTNLVGDEGGFAPNLTHFKVIKILSKYKSNKVLLGLDAAASELYNSKTGKYKLGPVKRLLKIYEKSNFSFIEDPFSEYDPESFKLLNGVLRVSDDLTVSNLSLVKKHIGCFDILLIKVNQVGYVSKCLDAISFARSHGKKILVSHRSGDSEDSFVADFALHVNADYVKFGAPCRSERTCKYNQMLRRIRKII